MFNLKKFRKISQINKYVFIGFQDSYNNDTIAYFNTPEGSSQSLPEDMITPENISNFEQYEREKNQKIISGKNIIFRGEQK